jgi:hypothetical protein
MYSRLMHILNEFDEVEESFSTLDFLHSYTILTFNIIISKCIRFDVLFELILRYFYYIYIYIYILDQ